MYVCMYVCTIMQQDLKCLHYVYVCMYVERLADFLPYAGVDVDVDHSSERRHSHRHRVR